MNAIKQINKRTIKMNIDILSKCIDSTFIPAYLKLMFNDEIKSHEVGSDNEFWMFYDMGIHEVDIHFQADELDDNRINVYVYGITNGVLDTFNTLNTKSLSFDIMSVSELPENYWDIIEANLPDYYSRSDVLRNSQLSCIDTEKGGLSRNDQKEFDGSCIRLYKEALEHVS